MRCLKRIGSAILRALPLVLIVACLLSAIPLFLSGGSWEVFWAALVVEAGFLAGAFGVWFLIALFGMLLG